MRQALLALLIVAMLALVSGVVWVDAARASLMRACGAGWTHSVAAGRETCLRAGQFCAKSRDRDYRRYGYSCTRYDTTLRRYRLVRGTR